MTAIGMIFLVLGIIVIVIGWNSNPRNGRALGAGALLLVGGGSIGIGGNPARDMPNGSPGMVAFGFVCTAVGAALVILLLVTAKKNSREQAVKMAEDNKIAFYRECVQNGIHACRSEKELQKATLIAQKQRLQFTDISVLFDEAKAAADKDHQEKATAALDAKKNEERSRYNEWNRFANLKGREKRIAILSAERAAALERAQALRSAVDTLMRTSQQKEHDWATHGGIASGIAGPAAGVAVAADIQAKNAQIRAQNDANLKAFAPVMMTSYSNASDYDRRANALQQEIEATKTKLVSNDVAADCLSRLSFSDTKVEVSETGTCTVTTSAALTSPLIIFDDVDAVVDGTVLAKLYDGGTLVGVSPLVLPKYGVKSATALTGMCLFCGTPGRNYTVAFDAVNLWAMER